MSMRFLGCLHQSNSVSSFLGSTNNYHSDQLITLLEVRACMLVVIVGLCSPSISCIQNVFLYFLYYVFLCHVCFQYIYSSTLESC